MVWLVLIFLFLRLLADLAQATAFLFTRATVKPAVLVALSYFSLAYRPPPEATVL